ncbi:hypothetical protein DM01DRAFT_1336348 [Hesseltinella vesiculosa]|uniref:JmjC domain-containing protein n=1 Tax=Hesseltinella vesiculosa TaxID=101127 RepID=A0A1X2GGE7_9FUNG|nr:hypothetical protein DM01DRAFT_1336348 [Hesseltinella vesiculosa]
MDVMPSHYDVFPLDAKLKAPFTSVDRLLITESNYEELFDIVLKVCKSNDKPLVISNFHNLSAWDPGFFDISNIPIQFGQHDIVGVNKDGDRKEMSMANFAKDLYESERQGKSCPSYAAQVPASPVPLLRRQKDPPPLQSAGIMDASDFYYAKDLDCPPNYLSKLQALMPSCLAPLGQNDLFGIMPKHLQAINLLCYFGGSGTGTPLHTDISGTIGHNLMTYADNGAYAQWLMIPNDQYDLLRKASNDLLARKARLRSSNNIPSNYVDSERIWISFQQLQEYNIRTYVVNQRPGDLVLVPSLCYHQVINVGVTMKIAWNRMTDMSLLYGIRDQLPRYQKNARPESYRCKATVYFALKHILNNMETSKTLSGHREKSFFSQCQVLLHLFAKHVLLPEMIERLPAEEVDDSEIIQDDVNVSPTPDRADYSFDVMCDFCHCDVFHRYYKCSECNLDLCMMCYATGRSCVHMCSLHMHEPENTLSNDLGIAEAHDSTNAMPTTRLQRYCRLYSDVIRQVNSTFGRCVLTPEVNTPLECYQTDAFSLATICRRIEMYRETQGYLCNKFFCQHCEQIFDLEVLQTHYNLDLKSIFGRRPCVISAGHSSFPFTCPDCTRECTGCRPLPVQPENTSTSKRMLYYQPIEVFLDYFGGYVDTGLYQSCSWPRFMLHQPEPSAKLKLKAKVWQFPSDFVHLAAGELINRITRSGWESWGKDKKHNVSLVLTWLLRSWLRMASLTLQDGDTMTPGTNYTYTPSESDVKHANGYFDLNNVALSIPSLDHILKPRSSARKRPLSSMN